MASLADPAHYPGDEFDENWRRLVFPEDYRPPNPRDRYHLVVIGAGPAGLVTAMCAAGLGAHVALVEKSAMGGDCLNYGCVPSKSLLEFTRSGRSGDDFDDAFEWLRRVRATIAHRDSVQRYVEAGVDVFLGSARFLDQDVVQVGHARLKTRRTVVATGSHPTLPPIEGLHESRPHTNETIFELKRRPKRLGIIGGGPIGCEMAQAFARMDVEVVLVENADRVLPGEAPEASAAVGRALRETGVKLRLASEVLAVERRGANVALTVRTAPAAGSGSPAVSQVSLLRAAAAAAQAAQEIVVDDLLVATGRHANTNDLNLVAVGVETDGSGRIVVDRYLRTTNHRIYGAGDVCSKVQLTHNADAHARIVAQNALFVPSAKTDRLLIPRCTYTDPEVAQIGPSKEQLAHTGTPFESFRIAFGDLDRGVAQNDQDAFAEVVTAAGSDRILGATLVGRDAGEQIAGLAVAMNHGLGLRALGRVVLPYPTRAQYLRRLADQYRQNRLTPIAQKVIGTWLRLRA